MRAVHCTLVSNLGKYLSSNAFAKSYYGMYFNYSFTSFVNFIELIVNSFWSVVGILCCNGHPYQVCLSPTSRSTLRHFSSKISVLQVSTSASVLCSGKDGDTIDKGENKKSDASAAGSSDGTTNKGGGKGKDGGNNHLSCPKCGDPCTHVETFVCTYYWFINIHL